MGGDGGAQADGARRVSRARAEARDRQAGERRGGQGGGSGQGGGEGGGGGGEICETIGADAIWLGTGNVLDVDRLGLLSSVRRVSPGSAHGGLPELTPSLQWADGWQLYVAGALSALQIGPEAFNLAGAGACAARIVERLLEDERVTSERCRHARWTPPSQREH